MLVSAFHLEVSFLTLDIMADLCKIICNRFVGEFLLESISEGFQKQLKAENKSGQMKGANTSLQ